MSIETINEWVFQFSGSSQVTMYAILVLDMTTLTELGKVIPGGRRDHAGLLTEDETNAARQEVQKKAYARNMAAKKKRKQRARRAAGTPSGSLTPVYSTTHDSDDVMSNDSLRSHVAAQEKATTLSGPQTMFAAMPNGSKRQKLLLKQIGKVAGLSEDFSFSSSDEDDN
jgi:hypothetical protein